jgi:hypothetical protein
LAGDFSFRPNLFNARDQWEFLKNVMLIDAKQSETIGAARSVIEIG